MLYCTCHYPVRDTSASWWKMNPKGTLVASSTSYKHEVTTMQGAVGLPRRTEHGDQSFGIWLQGAAALEQGYNGWSCPKPQHDWGGLIQHKTQGYKHNPSTIPHFHCQSQPTIAKTLNLQIQGALEQLQQTSPHNFIACLPAQNPQEEAAICGLGCSNPTGVEDPLELEGADSAMPEPMATSLQVLQCTTIPDNIHISVPISYSLSLPPVSISPTGTSIASTPQSETHPRADLGTQSEEVHCLQREMTPTKDGWYLILELPIVKMRPRLSRPLRRLRPSAQLQSGTQRLCAQPPSERQRPPMWIIHIPCNDPLMRVCKTWNMRQ